MATFLNWVPILVPYIWLIISHMPPYTINMAGKHYNCFSPKTLHICVQPVSYFRLKITCSTVLCLQRQSKSRKGLPTCQMPHLAHVLGAGFSLTNGIRGCSKVLRCIFVSFGISMGRLSSHTQCAQFAKLGVFWKI